MRTKFLEPEPLPDSPSRNKDPRQGRDFLLRAAGFTIHGRPEAGEPVWTRGGRLFAQAAALRLAGIEPRFDPKNPIPGARDVAGLGVSVLRPIVASPLESALARADPYLHNVV